MSEIHRPTAFVGVIAAAKAIADVTRPGQYREHMSGLADVLQSVEAAVLPGLESATTLHDASWPDLWLDRLHRPLVDRTHEATARLVQGTGTLSARAHAEDFRAAHVAWCRAMDSSARMRAAMWRATRRVG